MTLMISCTTSTTENEKIITSKLFDETLLPLAETVLKERNLIVLIDGGSNENPMDYLFKKDALLKGAMSLQFVSALNSKSPYPILVSESIVQSVRIRKKIFSDFVTLPLKTLQKKYAHTTLDIKVFKEIAEWILTDYIKIKDARKEKDVIYRLLAESSRQIKEFEQQDPKLFKNIHEFFSYYSALPIDKWATFTTKNGDFLFLPVADGAIADHGLRYSHLTPLSSELLVNTTDIAIDHTQFSTAEQLHTERLLDDLYEIVKPPLFNITPKRIVTAADLGARPLNIMIGGHGFPPLEKANHLKELHHLTTIFTKLIAEEDNTLLSSKWRQSQLLLLQEEMQIIRQQTEKDFSRIAGLFSETFNKKLVPILEKVNTKTLTYFTCFGGDINRLKAFKKSDNIFEKTTHSFTVINGALTLAPTARYRIMYYSYHFMKLFYDIPTNSELFPPYFSYRDIGVYLQTLQENISRAVSYYFKPLKQRSPLGVIYVPTIKLAGTDYWSTAKEVRNNILELSRTKVANKYIEKGKFVYNKPSGGAILLNAPAVLSPIEIQSSRQEDLPIIIPMVEGSTLQVISEIKLTNPSITIDKFIKYSIFPFFEQMTEVPSVVRKELVINKLTTANGFTTSIVMTKLFAMYLQRKMIGTSIRPFLSIVTLKPEQPPSREQSKILPKIYQSILRAGQKRLFNYAHHLKGYSKVKDFLTKYKSEQLLRDLLEELATPLHIFYDWKDKTQETPEEIKQQIVKVLMDDEWTSSFSEHIEYMRSEFLYLLDQILREHLKISTELSGKDKLRLQDYQRMVAEKLYERSLQTPLPED